MKIQGLQKLTLLDYPGKLAATIFTAGCNFRCPFCHNASLVTQIRDEADLPTEEVLDFLKKRNTVLQGVCISGGEPLLQRDIEDFLRSLKAFGYQVKLDTNGSNFDKLKNLLDQKLVDYVAMDIKNAPDKYGGTIGLEENIFLKDILLCVDYLKGSPVPYEFRTTLVREFHKREDMERIGQWLKGAKNYYLQEFVDSGDLIQTGLRPYNKEVMEQALAIVQQYVPGAKIRGMDSKT